jgi:hypothetical protein
MLAVWKYIHICLRNCMMSLINIDSCDNFIQLKYYSPTLDPKQIYCLYKYENEVVLNGTPGLAWKQSPVWLYYFPSCLSNTIQLSLST